MFNVVRSLDWNPGCLDTSSTGLEAEKKWVGGPESKNIDLAGDIFRKLGAGVLEHWPLTGYTGVQEAHRAYVSMEPK